MRLPSASRQSFNPSRYFDNTKRTKIKDDTSDPCFESIRLKKRYSIFQLHNIKLLFNCSKTILCHCNNIGRQKSRDTTIAMQLYCNVSDIIIELLPNPSS